MAQIIPNKIDRVLCNSAFWQVDAAQTLGAIKQILKPDGLFIFNLPDMFGVNISQQGMPNIRRMMRQLAENEYGFRFPEMYPSHPSPILSGKDAVLALLREHGYGIQHYEQIAYRDNAQATHAFYSIPIMTERALPNIEYATRMEILHKVFSRLDIAPNQETETVWDYYSVQIGV